MNATFQRIAVLDGAGLSPVALAALRELSRDGLIVQGRWPDSPPDEWADVDALVAGWRDHLPASALAAFPKLRHIALRGTSTDRIDLAYAKRHGIDVQPIFNYGDTGTAEFVIEQLLRGVRDFRFEGGDTARELAGRTLGLLGYGAVARRVAVIASALGMRVVHHTPSGSGKDPREPSTWVPAADLLSRADMISLHTPAYLRVLSADDLGLIRDDALVVITTLGLPAHVDDFDSWQRARAGRVVLDQCAVQGVSSPLAEIPGVDVAGVFAARTEESIERAERAVLDGLRRAAR
ncbi:2-hydroxyacid dehydrogenase [Streptomyces sp. NPDC048297]|uniref:2-hydroxyacid dehydrogenase n=1 Tax=Streptomyces sp. NPDC048297 TaxID=3365531 RepID=UPI003718F1E7